MKRDVSLNILGRYMAMVTGMAQRYGASCWVLLYQAEDRMRREQMTRIRRRGALEREKALANGHPSLRPLAAVELGLVRGCSQQHGILGRAVQGVGEAGQVWCGSFGVGLGWRRFGWRC